MRKLLIVSLLCGLASALLGSAHSVSTETHQGIIALATQSDVDTGSVADEAVTPATLAASLASYTSGLVSALPGTCSIRDMYLATDGPTLYVCVGASNWDSIALTP